MSFASGSVFRRRLMSGNALLQASAGIVVVLYLVALLQLTAEQWREFLVAGVILAGVSALVEIWMQCRLEGAVVACIDAQAEGTVDQGHFRRGFEAVMDLPRRMFLATQVSWVIAAIAVPGWMMLRLDDFSGIQPRLIAGVALILIVYATWARLLGWWLRALSLVALIGAIANPSLQEEDREPLSDIVIAIVDETSSQAISGRPNQNAVALAAIETEIAARPNTELRVKILKDGEGDTGSALMSALSEALSQEPQARIAGAILITDGQIHDIERAPPLPAPLHLLLTGEPEDWDRRIVIKNAPGFAIIGESIELNLKV